MLTGGAFGVCHRLGVGLCNIHREDILGARTQVQSAQGSIENLNLLGSETRFSNASLTAEQSFSRGRHGQEPGC